MSGADLARAATPALVALLALLGILGLSATWRRPAPGRTRAADLAGAAGLALTAVAWVVRWLHAGHLPIFGTFESALSLAVTAHAGAALVRWRGRSAVAWPAASLGSAALLGLALSADATAWPLTISERSLVLDAHAVIAWAAFAALLANAAFAARRLAGRGDGAPQADGALSLSLSIGFLLHSAMLASGSVYRFLLFGDAWGFDPMETLGLVTWLAYGTLLHLHRLGGWAGRRLARWCLGLFVLLVLSYRGIVLFPAWSTYHLFDMDRRAHVVGAEP